jgi:hypothetical protein
VGSHGTAEGARQPWGSAGGQVTRAGWLPVAAWS